MRHPQLRLISTIFTVLIIVSTFVITQHFLWPLGWAAIIALVTWPLFQKIRYLLAGHPIMPAVIAVLLVTFIIALPIFWLTRVIIKEAHMLGIFLTHMNVNGIPVPDWFNKLPVINTELTNWWNEYLAQPHGVNHLIKMLGEQITPISQFVKNIGLEVFQRSVDVGLTLLCLFFFYKDGHIFVEQLKRVGEFCLGDRYMIYMTDLPQAIISTVYGSVLVGLGVGILMGFSYSLTALPAPALFGLITAIFAMIPFGAPLVFLVVALILFAAGNIMGAILILVFGTIVLFIADHFIRPSIIGNATKLPFLAVLFGILGGIETLGLIGLFVGPTIMVLFLTLWREPLRHKLEK